MNKQSKNVQLTPEKLANPLTIGEWLILQGKRQEIDNIWLEMSQIKRRQNRQMGWIILLFTCVLMLMVVLLFVHGIYS